MQGVGGSHMKTAMSEGSAPSQAKDVAITGPGGAGGELSKGKDAQGSAADANFGELWKGIQSRYGAKAEKPREIKKTLGKDDFLKIMITQMKNQDPSKPFDAEQMASQMAQFASVEQLQNLNQNVAKMANGGQPLERLAMTNLIGKTVTVDRERFVHSENEASTLGYGLAKNAKSVKMKIISEQSGETVFEKDIGSQKGGPQTFVWDGAKTNGQSTKPGNYIYRVEATDESDRPIPMETRGQAKVVGVAFDGPEGSLLVGDANNPQKITMKNVIRIDIAGENQAPAIPGARSMANALQGQGVPSSAGDSAPAPQGAQSLQKPGAMNAEARKALEAYESAQSNQAKASDGKNISAEKSEKTAEKGFPSGLSSEHN